jgi:hypothetical protein
MKSLKHLVNFFINLNFNVDKLRIVVDPLARIELINPREGEKYELRGKNNKTKFVINIDIRAAGALIAVYQSEIQIIHCFQEI